MPCYTAPDAYLTEDEKKEREILSNAKHAVRLAVNEIVELRLVKVKEVNDELTRMLCMLCKHIENNTEFTDEEVKKLFTWYQQHKKFDEMRIVNENS